MAHIEDRRKSTAGYSGAKPWRARHRIPGGQERSRSFARKVDAERWIRAEQTKQDHGEWIDPDAGRVTFAAWIDQYVEDRRSSGRPYRATTEARDRAVARRWLVPHLGQLELRAITPALVDDLVSDMREHLAPATVRTNYGVLRAMMTRAVDREMIGRSPCRGIDMPAAGSAEPRFLSVDELHRLADVVPAEYRQMVYLGGVIGLRWSEVAGLRVGRVDFLGRSVTIAETLAEVEGRVMFAEPKSRASYRTVGIPPALVDGWLSTLTGGGGPGPTSWCSCPRRVSRCGRRTSGGGCGRLRSRRPGSRA